jgi:hypothetical protein
MLSFDPNEYPKNNNYRDNKNNYNRTGKNRYGFVKEYGANNGLECHKKNQPVQNVIKNNKQKNKI